MTEKLNQELIQTPIESAEIMKMLPHRYPFLLIDRVMSYTLEPEKTLTAIKNVSINEPFFQGHFPTTPVMPGVLILEAMAQACGVLAHVALATEGEIGGIYYLVKIDNAKFARKVVPGDQLLLEVKQTRIMRGLGKYEARCSIDGQRTASCDILCSEG
ncbi:MAG: 3-hydroxyacyl-ACP dehydratase FabZ [Xanthomonadales bacterium]|nr:3-hydroxyacyl-ACP dehydratase FabZ [Xanthomonadales bacterium]